MTKLNKEEKFAELENIIKRPEFIIEDWAGNHCFQLETFHSFEDAWGFLRENTPEDSWEEYHVEEVDA